MTERISLKVAVERGITKLRRDPWEETAHIEILIDHLPNGKRVHGPWVTLRGIGILDDGTAGQTETQLLWSEIDWTEVAWEPWVER